MTTTTQIQSEFKEFLIRNKVYKKFKKKIEKRNTRYSESLSHLCPDMYISSAFTWFPEAKFWNDINEKWINYVKENHPTETTCETKSQTNGIFNY